MVDVFPEEEVHEQELGDLGVRGEQLPSGSPRYGDQAVDQEVVT